MQKEKCCEKVYQWNVDEKKGKRYVDIKNINMSRAFKI